MCLLGRVGDKGGQHNAFARTHRDMHTYTRHVPDNVQPSAQTADLRPSATWNLQYPGHVTRTRFDASVGSIDTWYTGTIFT
jgi:hypothetical protein